MLDRPGLSVLDIGCGWGGMALTLARDYGARVLGVTLSTEQLARARRRADAAGLSDRVRFELLDYRDPCLTEQFDRIVSVGMFEHVGINHYDAFFRTVAVAWRRMAWRSSMRSAVRMGRAPPTPGSTATSSRAATPLPCRRCCRPSSAAA